MPHKICSGCLRFNSERRYKYLLGALGLNGLMLGVKDFIHYTTTSVLGNCSIYFGNWNLDLGMMSYSR